MTVEYDDLYHGFRTLTPLAIAVIGGLTSVANCHAAIYTKLRRRRSQIEVQWHAKKQ